MKLDDTSSVFLGPGIMPLSAWRCAEIDPSTWVRFVIHFWNELLDIHRYEHGTYVILFLWRSQFEACVVQRAYRACDVGVGFIMAVFTTFFLPFRCANFNETKGVLLENACVCIQYACQQRITKINPPHRLGCPSGSPPYDTLRRATALLAVFIPSN